MNYTLNECYWCENTGKTEPFFYDGEMRDMHPKCRTQIQGLFYTPTEPKKERKEYYIEKPPIDDMDVALNQLGGRNNDDLFHDEKGQYVLMADGHYGTYRYYL